MPWPSGIEHLQRRRRQWVDLAATLRHLRSANYRAIIEWLITQSLALGVFRRPLTLILLPTVSGISNGGLRPISAICAQSSAIVHFCGLLGPFSKRNFRHKMTTIVGNRGQLWTSTLSPHLLSPPCRLSRKYRDTNGRRIVIHAGGVYMTYSQQEGKHCD